jgi:hypothetical protein
VILIVVQYVHNIGIRYNCPDLVDEFYAVVRDDGHIDLNFVGGLTWWLGVRYTYDLTTGDVSADQETFIDKLLEQYTMTNCNPSVLPMSVGVSCMFKHLKLTWCVQTVKSLCYNDSAFSWKSDLVPILVLSTSETELISVVSCDQEVNFCHKLATEMGSSSLDKHRSLKITLTQSRCLNTGISRGAPNTCTFPSAWCATTSTLTFYVSFRPRHATRSQLSAPRLVLLLSSSSSVLSSSRWSLTRS